MVPESLFEKDLSILWQKVRDRLDKYGPDRRGILTLPPLSDSAALTIASLLNKHNATRIDLTELEHALLAQGIGKDLDTALDRLGAIANAERAASRAAIKARDTARTAVFTAISHWHDPWCEQWAEWLFRSGLMANTDANTAVQKVQNTRLLLDHIASLNKPTARNEIAARLYGSAHALDDGTALERCSRRALWYTVAQSVDYHQGREVWNAAGVSTDRVSTSVLTWQLKLHPNTRLGALCEAANRAMVPLHLSAYALEENNIACCETAKPVLIVENPRVLEAAAERQLPLSVIVTNGNPSTAVTGLIRKMISQGLTLYYHGDFDSAGIAICSRMAELGCNPWRMNYEDYESALHKAKLANVSLPKDELLCGESPWDKKLQHSMNANKKVVHEEFIVDEILSL